MAAAESTTAMLDDRVDSALRMPVAVDRLAENIYEITTVAGDSYRADPSLGACTCPDFEYRVGDVDGVVCKHCVRAKIAELTRDVQNERRDATRDEPSRSEPADFGGGETTGVQDL